MDLHVGEYRRIDVVTDPANAITSYQSYTTEDSSIISVDYNTGVVTALKEGTAKVIISVIVYGDEELTWEKVCIVNVKKEEEKSDTPSQTEQPVYPMEHTAIQNQVHGVPTGINTHFTKMMSTLLSSIISIVYLFRKKER